MIKNIKASNFRSLKDANIDFAPLTFVYGNNAAGKSSIFYAFNVLRNILVNPNQPTDSFFDLGFANLGSFNDVVFRHDVNNPISISVSAKIDKVSFDYGISIKGTKGTFTLNVGKPYGLALELPVAFPYAINANTQSEVVLEEIHYKISWNGINAEVTADPSNEQTNKKAVEIKILLNKMGEEIRAIDIVSVMRGFTQPQYGPVSVTNYPISEEEVAAKLASDNFLDSILSSYLEEIIDRQFRVYSKVGTALFRLLTIEKKTNQSIDLVNDGFGVNQLVYVLAKILNKTTNLICIEEPEINLHPGIIRRLPSVLYELVKKEHKQIIISTHSEALVQAVLSAIASGSLKPNDIAFYLTKRENDKTIFQKQEISSDGQVSGGLTSFMEGELETIQGLLKGAPKTQDLQEDKKSEENMSDGNNE